MAGLKGIGSARDYLIMTTTRRFIQIALAALLPATPLPAQSAAAPALVLTGATLIDGTDRPPRANATVVVRNGWITAVGDQFTVPVPRGAKVVDLRGKYLLPGFIDMHAHLAIAPWVIDSSGGKRELRFPYDEAATREVTRSQLAFGITAARNPAGPTNESVSLRNRQRIGELEGPRLFTAGWPLDRVAMADRGVAVATPEAARAEVRRQAVAGVDYIKLYAGLGPAEVRAGIDEAHRLGIRAIGHLWQTSWTDAAVAGIDGIVHIAPGAAALLPAASREEYTKGVHGSQFMFDWFKYVDFDGPEIKAMLDALTAGRVTIDPTLVAFEMIARSNDSMYAHESRAWTPPSLAGQLSGERLLTLGWTPADFTSAQEQFHRMLAFTKRLHDAGVVLTAGTDAANPWFFPRELELFVEAGISSAEVLRIATRNGAMSLGMISEFGTVEPGKRADLVVLGADPIADIRNTRRVEWVVQGGHLAPAASFRPERLRTPPYH